MKIRRIMVPTDFSEQSRKAITYAIELAREVGSEVVLVHVVAPLPSGTERWADVKTLLDHHNKAAIEKLELVQKESSLFYTKCRSEIHHGVVHEVISRLVSKLDIDLIVMSMRGPAKLLDRLFGRTSEKIILRAQCPVLRICYDQWPRPEI